ncbi:MAG: TonB-dependent receptor [candidate division Zixibacteria bacterium]|nr:TonB-dependent receptor [candidate division Zixibacteria bacterium]
MRFTTTILIAIIVSSFVLAGADTYCQENPMEEIRKGTIKGRVFDRETKTPLLGATVLIVGTQNGDAADLEGYFEIEDVPVGNYSLRFSTVGYEPLQRTDVIVKSGRITFINAGLKLTAVEFEGVKVTAGYFPDIDEQPTSSINFSSEEIRRAPGSAGDVSRIIAGLPSIAKVNDQLNSLIVRGGNPTENGFFIDNIEIPNINHYPIQGSSGGPIGLLNVDFIQDVDFSSGGFSAAYGDRLSSIMDLTFREGNRDEFDGQVELTFAGVGILAEGPLAKEKGSWMLSARKSYLDLLVDAIGTGVAPKYSDYQGKVVYDINSSNRLTVLGVAGIDQIEFDKETSEEDGNIIYGKFDGYEDAFGVNWRCLWSKKSYSNTAISYLSTKYESDINETKSDIKLSTANTLEQSMQLRNVNFYRFNESHQMEFGFDVKYYTDDYDHYSAEYTNVIGDTVPSFTVNEKISSPKYGAYINLIWKPLRKLTTIFGTRYDYFEYNGNSSIAPRFSFSYKLTDRTSLNGATGLYYQNLPLALLTLNEENKDLKSPMAVHYILGVTHLLTENTKLTIEVYNKEYSNFPLDPNMPSMFVVDETIYRGFSGEHAGLVDKGKAYSRGVEITAQKKLAQDIYGLVSGSYFKSRYKGFDGKWYDRVFDNQYIFSIEGGYKPNNKWEYSLRWIFAGGAPYTPLDFAASRAINRSVLDNNLVNDSRYPDYHSLNIRCDRRFHFSGSNLICYFSVWNAYGRKNVSNYFWNEIEQKEDVVYQWSLLPVMGFEFEF